MGLRRRSCEQSYPVHTKNEKLMADLRKWYAVRIKEGWSEKVISQLENNGLSCLTAISPAARSEKRLRTNEPGFLESLLFVRAEERLLPFITTVKGVNNFLFWGQDPALINEKEILVLRYFSELDEDLFLEKIPVNPGGEIAFTSGPFLLMDGDSYDVRSKAIKAELPNLGYIVAAEMDGDYKDPLLVLKSQNDISFTVEKR